MNVEFTFLSLAHSLKKLFHDLNVQKFNIKKGISLIHAKNCLVIEQYWSPGKHN